MVKEKVENEVEYEDLIGEYGIVKIIKGKYEGRFGYYDDDDLDYDDEEKAVIYLGDMFDNSKYVYIDYENITNNYTFNDLQQRSNEIIKLLWEKTSDAKRVSLLEEKRLIDSAIAAQYENFIYSENNNDTKVFLSHSSKDKGIVVSVALDLEKRGISSWLDAKDILPGESIVTKIDKGLSECDLVLLFLSKNSVSSSWVRKEWETILWEEVNSDKVKIITIKLDDCEVPKILQTKKYIDLYSDYNQGLAEILFAISEHRKKSN